MGFSLSGVSNSIGDAFGGAMDSLSGKRGLDEAAQGARNAQTQANQLAELQWQRQMEGLQRALGMMNPSQSLYDRIYGTNTAQTRNPQAGGYGMPGAGGGGAAGTGTDANGKATGKGPYGDGTSVFDHPAPRPDGTMSSGSPAPRATLGGYTIADTQSTPTYAPIMRGGPSSAGIPPQAPPGSAMTLRPPINPYLAQLQQSLGIRRA